MRAEYSDFSIEWLMEMQRQEMGKIKEYQRLLNKSKHIAEVCTREIRRKQQISREAWMAR